MTKCGNFREDVHDDAGEISNYCELIADNYFVSIITDQYEGHAMFHVSVARKLRDALDRAIAHVEKQGRK